MFSTTDEASFHLWTSHLLVAASLDYDILLKDDEQLLRDCKWMRTKRRRSEDDDDEMVRVRRMNY